jgi:membrane-anchored protein YejM (alkaline phosphatase superfamily)
MNSNPENLSTASKGRGQLYRWVAWFALANSLVFALIGLRYLSGYVPGETALAWIYLITVYISHHTIITVVPLIILATPLILLWPRHRVITVTGVLLFALMISVIMLDSMLWSQSRFHLNALTLKILGSKSWIFVAGIFLIALVFESILAKGTWNWLQSDAPRRGRLVTSICVISLLVSQGIYAWADASYYVPVTSLAQQLPVYRGVTAKSILSKTGLVDARAGRERQIARRLSRNMETGSRSLLNYPLNPLNCDSGERLNLLIILADAMRGDMITPVTAPNISAYAHTHGANFSNHFSGGNSSRMGAFSFFYGLPPGYWKSFSALQRSTVLVDRLQADDYQLGLFTSATMYRPVVLDRTAFANIPDLRMFTEPESDPAWKRDRKLTGEWFDWLDHLDPNKPFFGFLFYDATLGKNFPPDHAVQFQAETDDPLMERMARYKTAVHFVDSLVAEVLNDLDRRGLAGNTVVIISSDHGEEFDESGAGLKRHGSGYTRYQLQTPMVVSWPGRTQGEVYSHRTSHYDIVPTLMQDLLGCSNPASDYSVGESLFSMKQWHWLIAGSYFNYAVLEPDKLTITFPNGGFEVRDWDYKLIEEPEFDAAVLEAASEQNTRFYTR